MSGGVGQRNSRRCARKERRALAPALVPRRRALPASVLARSVRGGRRILKRRRAGRSIEWLFAEEGVSGVPLNRYGVLKGRAIERATEFAVTGRRYDVRVDTPGAPFRISVNVQSRRRPSDLLYLIDDDFRHPIADRLIDLAPGFREIDRPTDGPALDYVRGKLFDPRRLRSLPPDVPGPDNDLNERLDDHMRRALRDAGAEVYAFGQRWGPEPRQPDRVFGFLPGNGIHDIHMNQGNADRWAADNGVWQDGGLLLRFAAEGRWVGIFLAFQSQVWQTDDRTGHASRQRRRDV